MKKTLATVVMLAVVTVGCASMNNQQQGAAIGAAGGAALGAAVSKGSIRGVLIGAAVGGLAGNAIGKHMDQQARELEQAVPTAEVQRVGEGIDMTFDSSLWCGSSQPKVPNDSPENQARNRRVELAIYANDQMVSDAQDGAIGG
jgi:outer membrane protein OmpA-like peptidoglycan-associated protein